MSHLVRFNCDYPLNSVFSFRFFIVSVGSFWKYARPEHEAKASFQMTFFSFVFPNTALVTATFQIGRAFDCEPLEIVGCAMAGLLVVAWATVFGMMVRCIYQRKLLWPQRSDMLHRNLASP